MLNRTKATCTELLVFQAMYTEFEVFQEKYLKTFLSQDIVKFYKELKTSVVSKHTI